MFRVPPHLAAAALLLPLAGCAGSPIAAPTAASLAARPQGYRLVSLESAARPSSAVASAVRASVPAERGLSVLVIDDEPEVGEAVLASLGHEVSVVRSAEEALRVLVDQRQHFDLIVIDVTLPGMNGIQLTRTLRETPWLADARLMIVSGRVDPATQRAGREAGADHYLTKPYRRAQMGEAVARVVAARADAPARPDAAASVTISTGHVEFAGKSLSGMDSETELVGAFGLEIDGVIVGGFKEITGLESEVERKANKGEIKDAPTLEFTSADGRRTGETGPRRLVLKRGTVKGAAPLAWFERGVGGAITRKRGGIVYVGRDGQKLRVAFEAWPCRWKAPELNAGSDTHLVEELELVVEKVEHARRLREGGRTIGAGTVSDIIE